MKRITAGSRCSSPSGYPPARRRREVGRWRISPGARERERRDPAPPAGRPAGREGRTGQRPRKDSGTGFPAPAGRRWVSPWTWFLRKLRDRDEEGFRSRFHFWGIGPGIQVSAFTKCTKNVLIINHARQEGDI